MAQLRKGKQLAKTTTMVFESETLDQTKNNIAVALLCGAFNPLRKYSSNGVPIDLEKLKKLQIEFRNLLEEVELNMNVDILKVNEF